MMDIHEGMTISYNETEVLLSDDEFASTMSNMNNKTSIHYMNRAKELIIRRLLTRGLDGVRIDDRRDMVGGTYKASDSPAIARIFIVEDEETATLIWQGASRDYRDSWKELRDEYVGPKEYRIRGKAAANAKAGGLEEKPRKKKDKEVIGIKDEDSDIQFDIPLEEEIEDIEIPPDKRKIYTEQGDPEVDSLYGRYKRGKLVIQPDFQRHFVWDIKKSSRLIESALLDIPLPVIYLTENDDGKISVIDGQQRLTAFFSFIDGEFPDGGDFKLKGLQVFTELNGKKYTEIDEALQDKVRYCKVRTITFKKESQADLRFEIFERLNTGSVSLNDQELRNCIHRGPYNELLKELSKDPAFMYLLGLKKPDKRMKDVELVLRFAAFSHTSYLNYYQPMRRFLNDDMKKYQFISNEDAEKLKTAFKNSVTIITSLLDKKAFRRLYRGAERDHNGRWARLFSASLYDVLMFNFSKADKHIVFQNLDAIREAYFDMMTTDPDFIESIEIGTSDAKQVVKRFDKFRFMLDDVLGSCQREPRCFSYELKETLFDQSQTCGICGQRIIDIDDAALDHIEQYWKGGKTIPENARLAHRYCNWARPRNE